jgi:hypothetical protein
MDAAEGLEQRRFSGAVLADERDDLAGINLQADLAEGQDAGEALGDPLQLQQRLRHALGFHRHSAFPEQFMELLGEVIHRSTW